MRQYADADRSRTFVKASTVNRCALSACMFVPWSSTLSRSPATMVNNARTAMRMWERCVDGLRCCYANRLLAAITSRIERLVAGRALQFAVPPRFLGSTKSKPAERTALGWEFPAYAFGPLGAVVFFLIKNLLCSLRRVASVGPAIAEQIQIYRDAARKESTPRALPWPLSTNLGSWMTLLSRSRPGPRCGTGHACRSSQDRSLPFGPYSKRLVEDDRWHPQVKGSLREDALGHFGLTAPAVLVVLGRAARCCW